MASFTISGQLVDLHQRRTYPAGIVVESGRILSVTETGEAPPHYILPGFVDAHVHIESAMLSPAAFAQEAVRHGTVATVSDPHEIANVCGEAGVRWMIDNAAQTPFKIRFGAPSCVPATGFETAGAALDAAAIESLMAWPDIWYLAEMMNYPGVMQGDGEVLKKIAAAKAAGKPVDGHAPGLRGEAANQYAAAGISTDHECVALEEALDKIGAGMHILIREGSAAKNFDALHPLLGLHPDRVMLCSDDKHPDDLVRGHINELVVRAVELGYDVQDVLRAACVHPVLHYKLDVGLLRVGDPADFIVVEDLKDFAVRQTFIDGRKVAENGRSLIPDAPARQINHFLAQRRVEADFGIPAGAAGNIRVIAAQDGQLVTGASICAAKAEDGMLVSDTAGDVLKIVVINRYESLAPPAFAMIRGFGLQRGAIASTVAHDCHNIIAVGADDASLCAAINALIDAKGGVAVACGADDVQCLPLPIAGLMTDRSAAETGAAYSRISQSAKALGSRLGAPFMTLSFMALLVIPSLKLSDKGLFDGEAFRFVPLHA